MNKKAQSGFKIVFGAIALIISIGVLFWLFGLGSKPINETTRCAVEHCFAPTQGCPDDRDEPYYRARELKCDDSKLVCCTPESDPLSITAKAQEKEKAQTGGLPNSPSSIGRIHIYMNDELRELPYFSTRDMEIGKSYSFRISAEGIGANSCLIQVLDESKAKVKDASWLPGYTFGSDPVSCTEVKKVTVSPNDWVLSNQKYTLEVALLNETTRAVTTYSSVDMTFVISADSNYVIVS